MIHHDDTNNDRSRGSKLVASFAKTGELWNKVYAESYKLCGTLNRGKQLDEKHFDYSFKLINPKVKVVLRNFTITNTLKFASSLIITLTLYLENKVPAQVIRLRNNEDVSFVIDGTKRATLLITTTLCSVDNKKEQVISEFNLDISNLIKTAHLKTNKVTLEDQLNNSVQYRNRQFLNVTCCLYPFAAMHSNEQQLLSSAQSISYLIKSQSNSESLWGPLAQVHHYDDKNYNYVVSSYKLVYH